MVTKAGLTNLIEVVTKAGLTNLIEVVTKTGLTNLIEVVTEADKYLVSLTHYPDCEPISLCSYC